MIFLHVFVLYLNKQLYSKIFLNLFVIDNISPVYANIFKSILFVSFFSLMELFLFDIIKKLKFHILFFQLDSATLNNVYHFFLFISSVVFIILIGIKDSIFSYIFSQYAQPISDNYEYLKSTMKIKYDLDFITSQCVALCFTYFSNKLRIELHKTGNINKH